MMLPQSEARFKFCPLLVGTDGKMRFCQGSQCMMWRYRLTDKKGEEDAGYCGMAGKPAGAM